MRIERMLPCIADPEKFRVIGKVDVENFDRIMPYLTRVILNASYSEENGWINFKRGQKLITIFRDRSVALTQIKDETEAMEILGEIEEKAREAWEKRDQIDITKPMEKVEVNVLDVYSYLPKTNCRECGEQTCMAFAARLLNGEKDIRDCKPLFSEEKYAGVRETLTNLLVAAGYDVK